MKKTAITVLFIIAALYDGVLGLAFLITGESLFQTFQVPPPNHFGYVHFGAALLLVFALMYFMIAKKPEANRNLIPYGMLLKVSYCSVTGYHWFTAGIPYIWKPFFFFDLIFLGFFAWAYACIMNVEQVRAIQNKHAIPEEDAEPVIENEANS